MADQVLLRCQMQHASSFSVASEGGEVVLRFAAGDTNVAHQLAGELNRQLASGKLCLEVVRELQTEAADG